MAILFAGIRAYPEEKIKTISSILVYPVPEFTNCGVDTAQ